MKTQKSPKRKPKMKKYSLYLPEELMEIASREAKSSERSMNYVVRKRLEESFFQQR